MRRALAIAAVTLLACGGGGGGDDAPGRLEIHDARVEPSPTGRGPAGGFLVLANEGDRTRTLVGAASPAAERVELHRSWVEGGVARMEPVAALPVPARERVALEPGGHHLMLFGAEGLAEAGEVVLTLRFADGESREVRARVAPAGHGHAGHEHP